MSRLGNDFFDLVGDLSLLPPARVAALRAADFSYDAVVDILMSWRMHQGAGLWVAVSSKPVTRSARLGGPITGWIQRVMTERYLAALDDAR